MASRLPRPQFGPPPNGDDRLITYSSFLSLHRFPNIEETEENDPQRAEMAYLLETFTQKKQPGEKAKGAADAFLKGLMVPLNLRKAMDVEKVDWGTYPFAEREGAEEVKEGDVIRDFVERIKAGVWSMLPSFWTAIIQLVKEKRDFASTNQIFLNSMAPIHCVPSCVAQQRGGPQK